MRHSPDWHLLNQEVDRLESDINVAKYDQENALYKLVEHLTSTRQVNSLPADIQRTLIDVTLRREKINKLTVLKSNLETDMDLAS